MCRATASTLKRRTWFSIFFALLTQGTRYGNSSRDRMSMSSTRESLRCRRCKRDRSTCPMWMCSTRGLCPRSVPTSGTLSGGCFAGRGSPLWLPRATSSAQRWSTAVGRRSPTTLLQAFLQKKNFLLLLWPDQEEFWQMKWD
uniref:Secreted protein n=1 Tax=Ixodes ricinus TaxID=34613 RepID=A0A6B0UV14_IXORI